MSTEVATHSRHPSNVGRLHMSLKLDAGVIVDVEEKDVPEEDSASNPSETDNSTTDLATPKGPLPTLLFARKHSLNVPRAIVKSAQEEQKKVESMVTQVTKTGPPTPSNRPKTPSGRFSQDAITTSAASPTSPTACSSPKDKGGMLNRFFGKKETKPLLDIDTAPTLPSPVSPPSPSAIMSPSAGKAKEIGEKPFKKQSGLIGDQPEGCEGRKCLVLDLDETLVHSSFRPTKTADFIIPVEIDGMTHQVYVGKRPHVDEFLERMGKIYEIVIFTASLSKYANPLLDVLDNKHNVIKWRLYREHCTYHNGCYVKDLSRIGRPMNEILIVDNASYSYMFQPDNAIASDTWNDDPYCIELKTMADYLESIVDEEDLRMFTNEWNNCSSYQASRC